MCWFLLLVCNIFDNIIFCTLYWTSPHFKWIEIYTYIFVCRLYPSWYQMPFVPAFPYRDISIPSSRHVNNKLLSSKKRYVAKKLGIIIYGEQRQNSFRRSDWGAGTYMPHWNVCVCQWSKTDMVVQICNTEVPIKTLGEFNFCIFHPQKLTAYSLIYRK